MGFIYGMIKDVIAFMILVAVVMNLFGNKVYRKYASVFVGMVLVLIVVGPLLKWFQGEDVLTMQIEMGGYSVANAELESDILLADENGRNAVILKYKEQIREQIYEVLSKKELYLNKIEIIIEEDETSNRYGSVQKLVIHASRVEEGSNIEGEGGVRDAEGRIRIDRIRITAEGEVLERPVEQDLSTELLSEQIQRELASLYRLEEEQIHIRITV